MMWLIQLLFEPRHFTLLLTVVREHQAACTESKAQRAIQICLLHCCSFVGFYVIYCHP